MFYCFTCLCAHISHVFSFHLNLKINYNIVISLLVNTVSFEEEAYSVNEATGQVEIALVLSGASSTDIAVTVLSANVFTTGKYIICM